MGRGPLFSGVGAHPRASKPVHDSRNCLQSGGPRRSRIRNGADSVQSGTTVSGTTVIGTGIVDDITLYQAIVRTGERETSAGISVSVLSATPRHGGQSATSP
jgi:hypothetical protein